MAKGTVRFRAVFEVEMFADGTTIEEFKDDLWENHGDEISEELISRCEITSITDFEPDESEEEEASA